MTDELNGKTSQHPSGGDDLIDLVAQLRSIVARQQRTIAEQQTELATLHGDHDAARSRRAGRDTAEQAQAAPSVPPTHDRLMRAVPGMDYTIVFDGGAIGNPGRGYGSYQIVGDGGFVTGERLQYGERVTNNQAEYRTLIAALTDLRDRLGRASRTASVAIRGDSQLVVEQVNGRWKVKHPELQPLRAEVIELLRGFGRTDVAWHRRDASVRVLGH